MKISFSVWSFLKQTMKFLINSQLQGENQSCTLQSPSAFCYHLTLLNDATILQRDGWNTKYPSQVQAAELILSTSRRSDVAYCCLLRETKSSSEILLWSRYAVVCQLNLNFFISEFINLLIAKFFLKNWSFSILRSEKENTLEGRKSK